MGVSAAIFLAGVLGGASTPGDRTTPLVVRLGVDLVQIDVVVTDGKGRPVTDLTAADFEVRQDGKVQVVSHAAFMGSGAADAGTPVAPLPAGEATGSTAPGSDSTDAVVFVVDDLSLTLRSVHSTRRALLRFAEGMDEDDRIFLLRTSHQYSDLRPVLGEASLRAMANALRPGWSPRGFDPLNTPVLGALSAYDPLAAGTSVYLNQLHAERSLLALQDIVNALRSWRGRKTVVLFSEGYSMWGPRLNELGPLGTVYSRGDEVLNAVDRLTDLANRASVVINAIDPRGLVTTGISAADSIPHPTPAAVGAVIHTRDTVLLTSQDSLSYVADRTGGLAVINDNDVATGVDRILEGGRSYYLVGYAPERLTFVPERPRFHELQVRVKRRGLKVRSRKGFFGVSDETVTALAPAPSF